MLLPGLARERRLRAFLDRTVSSFLLAQKVPFLSRILILPSVWLSSTEDAALKRKPLLASPRLASLGLPPWKVAFPPCFEDPTMPLYEMTWRDAPSLLVSAFSAGHALSLLRDALGDDRLALLEDFNPLHVESFVVVRRCGKIFLDLLSPAFRFCPEASHRVFLIRQQHAPFEQAVVLVESLAELPPLILWHFGLLEEDECQDEGLVRAAWDRLHDHFALLEIDSEGSGPLLRYEYCACSKGDGRLCHPSAE